MDKQKILKMYDKGHSVDYIIGYMVIECNRETKQWDKLHHQWLIKKPKFTRQDISHLVYETLYKRHLEQIKKGEKVYAE